MIGVKDFLKKYSSISNNFIDDFFSINSYEYFEDSFVINLDVVAKWLGSHKGNLKSTLLKSYKKC